MAVGFGAALETWLLLGATSCDLQALSATTARAKSTNGLRCVPISTVDWLTWSLLPSSTVAAAPHQGAPRGRYT
jgi:hypothetical protein